MTENKILKNILESLGVRSGGVRKVAQHLLFEIKSGRLPFGAKVPSERELSQQFNVSRGSVRRVLSEFRKLGLVESSVGSGTFVSKKARSLAETTATLPVVPVSPAQLMEARQYIEPLMPELIVRNATPQDFERMRECLRQSESAKTIDEFEYWDGELHKALATATQNSFFILILELTNLVREQGEWGSLKRNSLTESTRAQYEEQHREIVTHLIDRDAEKAKQALMRHLEQINHNLFSPAEKEFSGQADTTAAD